MKRISIVTGLLVAVTVVGLDVAPAYAWTKTFGGTRQQVRNACAAVGGVLVEGSSYTQCSNPANSTFVDCNDDGACHGSGPGQGPNRTNANASSILGGIKNGPGMVVKRLR